MADSYIETCKQRARYFLDIGEPAKAIASMEAHLMKVDEYRPIVTAMMPQSRQYTDDLEAARKYVEGWR